MGAALGDIATQAKISLKQQEDRKLLVVISGSWRLASLLPSADELKKQTDANQVRRIAFETDELKDWDSGLLTFLIGVKRLCAEKGIEVDLEGLPSGVRRLLKLAAAVPEREDAREKPRKEVFLDLIGASAIAFWRSTVDMAGERFPRRLVVDC